MFNKDEGDKNNRQFQKGMDMENCRRQREDERLQLRKQSRENRLKRRRENIKKRHRTGDNGPTPINEHGGGGGGGDSSNSHDYVFPQYVTGGGNQLGHHDGHDPLLVQQSMLQQLPNLVQGCYTNHVESQVECARRIRKLLSIEKNPPIQQVIETGIIPRFVQFLSHNSSQLQFEAAWALTNIASGTAEHTAVVIKYGAVPKFVDLLKSNQIQVVEQAVWGLGNIAGDSPECRNLVLEADALPKLIPLCRKVNLKNPQELSLLRNATWTLSNFCRGKPHPAWKFVKDSMTALVHLLDVRDNETLQDACWAFSYLSDVESNGGEEQKLEAIIQCGAASKLINLLRTHRERKVKHPALRTIGNIVTGDDKLADKIIELDALQALQALLDSDISSLKKEACWTISNITAGTHDQITQVIKSGLIDSLIKLCMEDKFEVKKEALWALSNATSGGDKIQIKYMVHKKAIPAIVKLIDQRSQIRTLAVALEGLENILKSGENFKAENGGENPYVRYAEEAHTIELLEKLQGDENIPDIIFQKAGNMVKKYFGGRRDDGDDDLFADANSDNRNNNDDNFDFGGFDNESGPVTF